MRFKNLVEHIAALDSPKVTFRFLREKIDLHHAGVGKLKVWGVTYPVPNRQAFYRLVGENRTSAYDEPFDEVEICYCLDLDNDVRDRRYALTKELMHVFDSENERVNTKEKFKQLLREIQNKPLLEHASPMYKADINTRWKAVIALCPKKFRNDYHAAYVTGKMEPYEISEKFMVPEWIVPFVMDDYYNVAYDSFMQ